MATYTIGLALALLPERWRPARFDELGVNWPRATAISALVEGFGAMALLVVWYSIFVTRLGNIIGSRVDDLYGGYVGLFSLALHPLTWVICYFGCEGVVRFLAAVVTRESCGTLPLAMIAWGLERAKRWRDGKFVADEITVRTSEYDLQVASCRAKQHWKYPLTIRYDERFYQVIASELRSHGSRPYVYFLRLLPSNEIIKGLDEYDPKSATDEEMPGFLASVYGEVRRRFARP